jgi:hydrogenase-4 component E
MNIVTLSHYEQAIFVLSALVLYTSFSMLAQSRLFNLINIFAWQGTLLGMTAALVAFISNQPHLYISALLTLVLKAWLIPWMLRKQVIRLKLQREIETLATPTLTSLAGVGLVIFSYYIALPIKSLSNSITRNTISESLAIVLLAMLLIITRRQAVSQVVGFMAIENGLFFAALVSTYGMPMIVELGIAFDVLVAAVLFGVFFFEMRSSIDSLDVDQMNRLHEVDKR